MEYRTNDDNQRDSQEEKELAKSMKNNKKKITILKVLDNEMKKAHKYPIKVVFKEYMNGWKKKVHNNI